VPVLVQPPLASPSARAQHVVAPGAEVPAPAATAARRTPPSPASMPAAPRVEPFVPPAAPSMQPAAPTAATAPPPRVEPQITPFVPPKAPVTPAPAVVPGVVDTDAPAPQYRRFQPIVVVAVGAALVALVAVAGAAAYILRPETPDAATASPATAVQGASAGASVHVEVAGSAQWVRLELGGEKRAEGRGGLDANVLPGGYTLVIKQVGRGAVRGDVIIPPGGLQLTCTSAGTALSCAGGATLTLR
jgi:hypothetical protein